MKCCSVSNRGKIDQKNLNLKIMKIQKSPFSAAALGCWSWGKYVQNVACRCRCQGGILVPSQIADNPNHHQ